MAICAATAQPASPSPSPPPSTSSLSAPPPPLRAYLDAVCRFFFCCCSPAFLYKTNKQANKQIICFCLVVCFICLFCFCCLCVVASLYVVVASYSFCSLPPPPFAHASSRARAAARRGPTSLPSGRPYFNMTLIRK